MGQTWRDTPADISSTRRTSFDCSNQFVTSSITIANDSSQKLMDDSLITNTQEGDVESKLTT